MHFLPPLSFYYQNLYIWQAAKQIFTRLFVYTCNISELFLLLMSIKCRFMTWWKTKDATNAKLSTSNVGKRFPSTEDWKCLLIKTYSLRWTKQFYSEKWVMKNSERQKKKIEWWNINDHNDRVLCFCHNEVLFKYS